MKKILITGFSGFVASHFIDYLYSKDEKYMVVGVDICPPRLDYSVYNDKIDIKFISVDMMNSVKIEEIIKTYQFEYILHLAAFSSVAFSWKHPNESFINNCNIFLNLVSVVREYCPTCRILSVGSSEEYGNVRHEDIPIRENQAVAPLSPYAVARVSQEMLSKIFANSYGLEIVMTRSFNHIGPGQDERFVVPSFVKRILEISHSGHKSGEIETGDLSIIRDFVDVRDVVRAYYLLLMEGKRGEVYNVCSGVGIPLKKVVDEIAEQIGVKVTTRINPDYVRPSDNMEIVGSNYKIMSELGWKPTIKFRESIRDMIQFSVKG